MSWTLHKPTKAGRSWYREPGVNLDKPFPVWVYDVGQLRGGESKIVYAHLMPPHEKNPFTERVRGLKGEWAGPIVPPPVFEERESNP